MGGGEYFFDDFFRWQISRNGAHFGAMNHDVGDFKFCKIKETAEHFLFFGFNATFTVKKINRATQFFRGRENGVIITKTHAKGIKKDAHKCFDRHCHRTKKRNNKR